MNNLSARASVGVCETQPVIAEGVRALLSRSEDLVFLRSVHSLHAASDLVRSLHPTVLLLDKAMGTQALFQWLHEYRRSPVSTAFVVWGVSISEPEAVRFLQTGVRGILRKTAEAATLVSCLRSVAAGTTWMEETIFQNSPRASHYPHSELTPRELQVFELVEQGLKNSEIASELGIRPGTVKIHLKHIFEKTGVRGRYGLAISGLKERGLLTLTA